MTALRLLIPVVYFAFMIFAFVDVLLTQNWRVRGIPKAVWAFVVILINPIGGILWFVVGKEPIENTPPARTVAPDDDPDFLARMRLKDDQDERIRRLEQELADLDSDSEIDSEIDGDQSDGSATK